MLDKHYNLLCLIATSLLKKVLKGLHGQAEYYTIRDDNATNSLVTDLTIEDFLDVAQNGTSSVTERLGSFIRSSALVGRRCSQIHF